MTFLRTSLRSTLLLEHDLFRKPVSTPDQVRGRPFGIMLYCWHTLVAIDCLTVRWLGRPKRLGAKPPTIQTQCCLEPGNRKNAFRIRFSFPSLATTEANRARFGSGWRRSGRRRCNGFGDRAAAAVARQRADHGQL